MGRDQQVIQREQRMVRWRLRLGHDVEARAPDLTRFQGIVQGVLVDKRAARRVDQEGLGLHHRQLGAADRVARLVVQRRVQGHEVRLLQESRQVDHPGARLRGGLRRHVGIEGQHLEPERQGLRADGSAYPAEPDHAQRLAAEPHHAHRQAQASPARRPHRAVEGHDTPVPGQEQSHHVVRHLVDAVVGHVGHGDAQLGGRIHGDVVHADAEPADDDAPLRGPNDLVGHLGEAGQDAVDVAGHGDEGLLSCVGRDDELGAGLSEDRALGLDRWPDVVGDQNLEGH